VALKPPVLMPFLVKRGVAQRFSVALERQPLQQNPAPSLQETGAMPLITLVLIARIDRAMPIQEFAQC